MWQIETMEIENQHNKKESKSKYDKRFKKVSYIFV